VEESVSEKKQDTSKTVFMVTDGEGLDFKILGVWSSRKLAEIAKVYFAAGNEVTEWILDAGFNNPPGLLAFCLEMDRDGNIVTRPYRKSCDRFVECSRYFDLSQIIQTKLNYKRFRTFNVWAKDEEDAIKIADEKRVALIAENKWESPYIYWV
jgi:hypothetical protein